MMRPLSGRRRGPIAAAFGSDDDASALAVLEDEREETGMGSSWTWRISSPSRSPPVSRPRSDVRGPGPQARDRRREGKGRGIEGGPGGDDDCGGAPRDARAASGRAGTRTEAGDDRRPDGNARRRTGVQQEPGPERRASRTHRPHAPPALQGPPPAGEGATPAAWAARRAAAVAALAAHRAPVVRAMAMIGGRGRWERRVAPGGPTSSGPS